MAGRGGRRWRLVRARRDAVPSSLRRLSHTVQARRPRLRPTRAWLLAVLGVAVVGVLGWLVFGTSVLGVRSIEVTGSRIASPAEVRAVAAVAEGTPLARVDTGAVAARVRSLPSVASVEVTRSWPSTLVIEIIERTPLAVVDSGAGFLVLDREGVVFDKVGEAPEGLVPIRLTAGAGTVGPNDAATRAGVRVAAALTPQLRARLRELVVESPSKIRLELTGGLLVIWGDAERSDVKARVATALLGKAGKRIDVTAPEVAAVA